MGWHKLAMKHGIGSPGYVARRIAKAYKTWKSRTPSESETEIIRRVFVERIAAQTIVGGPAEYHFLKQHPSAIDEIVKSHPDLFSIALVCVAIEHPELLGPRAPQDAFQVLGETLQEVLDAKVPEWTNAGVWKNPYIVCQFCKSPVAKPNPAKMYVTLDSTGKPEYLCEACALPLHVRAMSALGFFMSPSHSFNDD
jgi:hypothetical protein